MSNQLSPSEMRRYALAGAEARLAQITEEAETIRRAFPELGGNGAGRNGFPRSTQPAAADDQESGSAAPKRTRRSMSAAQRKAVGERMKKYWAARRGGSSESAVNGGTPDGNSANAQTEGVRGGAKASTPSAKRGPRTMSAAARKRISEAQKARWADRRKVA